MGAESGSPGPANDDVCYEFSYFHGSTVEPLIYDSPPLVSD